MVRLAPLGRIGVDTRGSRFHVCRDGTRKPGWTCGRHCDMERILERLDAVREWVETGIAKTLGEDPSGFLLGVESLGVIEALNEIEAAIKERGESPA